MIKTKQPIVHLFIFAIFLVAGLVMFIYTQKQLRLISTARAEVDQLAESQKRLTELATLLPTYSLSGRTWQMTLPENEKEVAGFAASIEAAAKGNGLTIGIGFDDFPGPVDVSGHYIAGVGAEITLTGSYSGVSAFLTRLASLPYYFKIDKMTLTKPENKVGVKAILNGSLMMNLPI